MLTSFADFGCKLGDLQFDMPISYAVRDFDFYNDGGNTAVIVRLYRPPPAGSGIATQQVQRVGLRGGD